MIPDLHLEPTTDDLLCANALLMVDNDALKISANVPMGEGGRRDFTRDDLERGRSMGPMAFMTGAGKLCMRLNS